MSSTPSEAAPELEAALEQLQPSVDNKDTEMNNSKIEYIGIDCGFGAVKVCAGDKFGINKLYKFPSAIAPVTANEHFNDNRAILMDGKSYYIGEDALGVESDSIYELIEYKHLEAFSSLILHKIFRDLECDPTNQPKHIVLGLSIAHIDQSGHYKSAIQSYLNAIGFGETKLKILPQGAGVKVAYDTYAETFPNPPQDFNSSSNFLIADIGFNTLDGLYVMGGKVNPSNVRGIENKGLVVVAAKLNELLSTAYNREYGTKELQKIMDDGFIKIRGKRFDLTEELLNMKRAYLTLVEECLEAEFGKILDKVDYILLSGGGAYYFKDAVASDPFYRATANKSEFYNSIGYYLNACK
ncbi:hypothetical protein NVP1031O_124 [Vibrio phage 1.031.O._10N.261.46.F8]|nr:hypothetical protein NVP1031O_124 [Vibrio phage 1.031.O._10N.261.46.F8]